MRVKAALLCLRYPGIKTLIVRRTYKELQNNHIEQLRGMLHGIARYNKSDKLFTFCNGSTIAFGYCACDSDMDQYQGAEYDVIFLDEATQLDELWTRKITACVRGVNDFPKRVYYTCNPGGRGHGYIKRLFIDRQFEPDETPEEYRFIQALATDNKALMAQQPDYIKQLRRCRRSCGRPGFTGSGISSRGSSSRNSARRRSGLPVRRRGAQRRSWWRRGGIPTSSRRLRRRWGGSSTGALTLGMQSRLAARGGPSTTTGDFTGFWSFTAASGTGTDRTWPTRA